MLPRTHHAAFIILVLLTVLLSGCAGTMNADTERIHPVYQEKIREWQMRIQREGWSENHVHLILVQFRGLSTYHMEFRDHWDTPKEFIQKGFSGDCEDIAAFMMGSLKRLGYPHEVNILVVHNIFEDHAMLRVEMPGGGWRVYDVVKKNIPVVEESALKPVVEFNEKKVRWFPAYAEIRHDRRNQAPNIAGNTVKSQTSDNPKDLPEILD
jgi:hypothetical protein